MATIAHLVARSGHLKRDLVRFGQEPPYQEGFHELLLSRKDPSSIMDDENRLMAVFDQFVLQDKLPDGTTVVEQFVAAHPDLPDAERDMLLGWRDVVEGVFEVQRQDGDVLVVDNLIDDLTYRVHCNAGPSVFRHTPRRSFVLARLVPVAGEWLISGPVSLFPASEREHVYRIAADLVMREPTLLFRNPDTLARAWERQRVERDWFIGFFGTDLIVVPGDQLAARMRRYREFRRQQVLAALPIDDQARHVGTSEPEFTFAPALVNSRTVGVIYDELDGLNYYAGFGLLEAVFASPTLVRLPAYKQLLLDYLYDDSVGPLPLRRLADRDPQRASLVFQKLMPSADFDWDRDGEFLLSECKAAYFDRPPLPSITPISERLVPYVATPSRSDESEEESANLTLW